MSILKDVLAELFGMFLGDLRLSAAILAVVLASAGVIALGADPLVGGAVLLLGCLAVVITAVVWAARQKRAANGRLPRT
jgi:hypothetical protein